MKVILAHSTTVNYKIPMVAYKVLYDLKYSPTSSQNLSPIPPVCMPPQSPQAGTLRAFALATSAVIDTHSTLPYHKVFAQMLPSHGFL